MIRQPAPATHAFLPRAGNSRKERLAAGAACRFAGGINASCSRPTAIGNCHGGRRRDRRCEMRQRFPPFMRAGRMRPWRMIVRSDTRAGRHASDLVGHAEELAGLGWFSAKVRIRSEGLARAAESGVRDCPEIRAQSPRLSDGKGESRTGAGWFRPIGAGPWSAAGRHGMPGGRRCPLDRERGAARGQRARAPTSPSSDRRRARRGRRRSVDDRRQASVGCWILWIEMWKGR